MTDPNDSVGHSGPGDDPTKQDEPREGGQRDEGSTDGHAPSPATDERGMVARSYLMANGRLLLASRVYEQLSGSPTDRAQFKLLFDGLVHRHRRCNQGSSPTHDDLQAMAVGVAETQDLANIVSDFDESQRRALELARESGGVVGGGGATPDPVVARGHRRAIWTVDDLTMLSPFLNHDMVGDQELSVLRLMLGIPIATFCIWIFKFFFF